MVLQLLTQQRKLSSNSRQMVLYSFWRMALCHGWQPDGLAGYRHRRSAGVGVCKKGLLHLLLQADRLGLPGAAVLIVGHIRQGCFIYV